MTRICSFAATRFFSFRLWSTQKGRCGDSSTCPHRKTFLTLKEKPDVSQQARADLGRALEELINTNTKRFVELGRL